MRGTYAPEGVADSKEGDVLLGGQLQQVGCAALHHLPVCHLHLPPVHLLLLAHEDARDEGERGSKSVERGALASPCSPRPPRTACCPLSTTATAAATRGGAPAAAVDGNAAPAASSAAGAVVTLAGGMHGGRRERGSVADRGLAWWMGWDGWGWDGMGLNGMGWDGMGWNRMAWDGMGWDGIGWDGMG
ncbi:unnamed protein product [Closterium sp. NIES-54]